MVYVLKALLTHGANIEAQDDCQWTSLMIASRKGHLVVVEVSYTFEIHGKSRLFRN